MMEKFMAWIDARFPATKMWEDHLSKYYAPKNFNFFYFFGSLALLVLVNQIVTGVWLTMSYTPSAEEAFASLKKINVMEPDGLKADKYCGAFEVWKERLEKALA